MDFGSQVRAGAVAVSAVLGTLVLDQGDAAGLVAVSEARTHYLPPRSGHHHLTHHSFGGGNAWSTVGNDVSIAESACARAAVPFSSDAVSWRRSRISMTMPRRSVEMRRLSRMGHDLIVVHTLAREEVTLDVGGAAEFVDLESGRKLLVQPSAARESYVAAVARWMEDVERQLRREGIDYLRLITGDPLEPALRRFLVGRRGLS